MMRMLAARIARSLSLNGIRMVVVLVVKVP